MRRKKNIQSSLIKLFLLIWFFLSWGGKNPVFAESIPPFEGKIYALINGIKYPILDSQGKIAVFVRSLSSNPTKWRDTYCNHGMDNDFNTIQATYCLSGVTDRIGTKIWIEPDANVVRFRFGEDWGFTTLDGSYSGAYGCDQSPHSFEAFFTSEAERNGIFINGNHYPVNGGRWENKYQGGIYINNNSNSVLIKDIIWYPPQITPTPPNTPVPSTPTPTPTASPTPSLTPTPTNTPPSSPSPTPTPTTLNEPWFQTQEGDVHSNADLISKIPDANKFFSLSGEGGYPGLVSTFTEDPFFGQGKISEKNWLAVKIKNKRRYDYSYFDTLLEIPQEDIVNNGLLPSILEGNKINEKEITNPSLWKIDGDLEVEDLDEDLGVKVFLVSGKIIFKNDLDLQKTLPVFIAQGDIEIQPAVHLLNAILISDGMINTGDIKEDKNLTIKGAAICWNSFSLERERETNNQPAEVFVYNPKIYLSLASLLGRAPHLWEELAP